MQDEVPDVEGLRLTERSYDAGRGEIWRARVAGGLGGDDGARLPGELAGVGECTVRLLRLPVDEAMRARALVVARDLLALDDPGLVRVLEARRAFDGIALVLETPTPPVTGLDELARRRQLAAGEVVTIGIAIGWALGAAHTAGMTHGQLRDADVLLPLGGRPVLAGVGVMAVLGSAGSPRDDVRALARLLASVLDGESAGASRVLDAVEPARGAGADTPQELATRLAAAAAAIPVELPIDRPGETAGDAISELPEICTPSPSGPPSPPRPSRPSGARHRRGRRRGLALRRRHLLGVLAAAILIGSGLVGWVSAPSPSGRHDGSASAGGPAARDPDWRMVLTQLASARAAAFAAPDGASPARAALATVDVPGSPAHAADVATLADLRRRGLHASGLRLTVLQASVRERSSSAVILLVRDQLAAYQLLNAEGLVVRRQPARSGADHVVELRKQADGWRIVRVSDPRAAPRSAPPAAADAGT
jgi:hypothetical protein